MMLTIRLGKPSERAALEALQWRASLAEPTYREALLAHPDVIALPDEQLADGRVLVAEMEVRVVGFAVVLPRDDGDAELDGLFVEPDCWRRGVGARLVDEAEALARTAGAARLHVVANPDVEAFYLTRGFVETGRAQTRFGEALSMERDMGRDAVR